MKDVQQSQNMSFIPAIELRLANIIDNHVTYFFAAMFEGQEVLSECRCSDFRQVFMLCDSKHLLFSQATQSDAIFKRDHVCTGVFIYSSFAASFP